ncbi:MAG: hypothetical protein MZU91_11425 [Desulfosudis oleivorans]|nr:hypothetical protein [Desulfosudis oleivorans]
MGRGRAHESEARRADAVRTRGPLLGRARGRTDGLPRPSRDGPGRPPRLRPIPTRVRARARRSTISPGRSGLSSAART